MKSKIEMLDAEFLQDKTYILIDHLIFRFNS